MHLCQDAERITVLIDRRRVESWVEPGDPGRQQRLARSGIFGLVRCSEVHTCEPVDLMVDKARYDNLRSNRRCQTD